MIGNPSVVAEKKQASYVAQKTAPEDTGILWIDTANGDIIKYYNGTDWVPVRLSWAE